MQKVLIVEDEESIRSTITMILEDMDLIVFQSPNGRHALETLKVNDDINLVITDMVMPEMDGRELIREIHDDESINNMPILIISGYVGMKEIADLLRLGATMFIPKPLKSDELREGVERCLEETTL